MSENEFKLIDNALGLFLDLGEGGAYMDDKCEPYFKEKKIIAFYEPGHVYFGF